MFLRDMRGETIRRNPLAAEPAEGLTRRYVDALHLQHQHERVVGCTSSKYGAILTT